MLYVLAVFALARLLYNAAKTTLGLARRRVVERPRGVEEVHQFMQAVCVVYECNNGADVATLALQGRAQHKRVVWALALLLAAVVLHALTTPSHEPLVTQAVQPPFLHELLSVAMPECRDAASNETYCAVDAQWLAPSQGRHFFVDDDARLWFTTTRVDDDTHRLWREEALIPGVGDCACASDVGLSDDVMLLRHDATWLTLYDAHLVRTPQTAHWVQSTRHGFTRHHHDAVIVSYAAPLASEGGVEQTLLRDYNRRARPHNWTVLRRVAVEYPRLVLSGASAACFSHCSLAPSTRPGDVAH